MKGQLVRLLWLITAFAALPLAAASSETFEGEAFSPLFQPFSVFPTTKKVPNLIKRREYSPYDFGSILLASSKDPKHTSFAPVARQLPDNPKLYRQYFSMGFWDVPNKPVFCGSCPNFPNYVSYYSTPMCLGFGTHLMILLTVYMSSFVSRMHTDMIREMGYLTIGDQNVGQVTMKAFEVQIKSNQDLIITREYRSTLEVKNEGGSRLPRSPTLDFCKRLLGRN